MNPKKIGIIGTNSAGKTTLCYTILAALKKAGAICDGTLQQDRRLGFQVIRGGKNLLDVNPMAQWSLLLTQMKAEADLSLGEGVDILVSDRSPLDLYAYYVNVLGGEPMLGELVTHWCMTTFTKLYLLRPVKYEKTTARIPTETFRDSVHATLIEMAAKYPGDNLEIEPEDESLRKAWRKKITRDIIVLSGRSSGLGVGAPKFIATTLGCDVLIGGSYAFGRATMRSDLDLHVMVPPPPGRVEALQAALGVEVEILPVPNKEVWEYLKSQGFIEALHA